MGILYDLKNKYRYKRVSIVGMAKNAGKTTALNYLIEEAMDEGLVLGITSTGRDGESADLVTGTDKPKVYLDEDTLVSVPKDLYDLAEAGLEILKMTDYRTSLGQVMICKVVDGGYVQIAGPVINSDTKKLCNEMMELGAEMIIIDGAIDRKSIAAPDSSDAIILSTGAVLGRSIKKVASETAHVVGLYNLPVLDDEDVIDGIGSASEKGGDDRILIIGDDGVKPMDLKTGLNGGRFIDAQIDEGVKYVYIPGAFTTGVLDGIAGKKMDQVTFVVKDPTKIFIDAVTWQRLAKKGLKVSVLQGIKVAAVTVNPYSPSGYSFEHRVLLEAVEAVLPNIPVIDVRL